MTNLILARYYILYSIISWSTTMKLVLNPHMGPKKCCHVDSRTVIVYVLSRAINFGRQCHFKIWLDCHFKIFPCLIMLMSTNCQKNDN
jgi:hypothetical protein